jgi:nucleoside-diphosphate-sugar epimerase
VRVVITGAAGRIGRHMIEELAPDHDLRLIDRVKVRGHPACVADLGRRPRGVGWRRWLTGTAARWEREIEGADAVLHLAGNANPRVSWPSVAGNNVAATWNVLEVSARCGVGRVVLASSCRWVLGLEREDLARSPPARYDSSTAPRPFTPYGLSKAVGELTGRMFVHTGSIRSVVAVRIGTFTDHEPSDPQYAALWIAPPALRAVLRRSVEAVFEGFHIVYAVAPRNGVPVDLAYTRALLGWPEGSQENS